MRILIATDSLSHTEAAIGLGARLLRVSRTGDVDELADQAAGRTEPATLLTVIRREADRPYAEAGLARTRELLVGLNVQTRIRLGHPTKEIIREAAEGAYDLVILGKGKKRNPIARWLQRPTTATRVAKGASCSVLIAQGQGGAIRRILLCDSGAEPEPVLGRFTAQLAELLNGEEEITVLHVMSQIGAGPGVRGVQLRAEAGELIEEQSPEGELLERELRILDRPGIHSRPKVRHGLVVAEILAEAQSGDYDLVVIGAHRGQGWQRVLLDDLARKIVTQVDRPVLVVR